MGATLPPLPYDYNALEPHISEEIMKLHHDKHHQTYVTNLNAAEDKYAKATSIKEKIALQSALKFNGGGHINHSLFWKILAPAGKTAFNPNSLFGKAVIADFGGKDELIKSFNEALLAIQGSGWGWLGVNPKTNKLEITTTANQDPLITHINVIGIDMWEHAYYPQYKNVKAEYAKAIWNVINYDEASKRYEDAVNSKVDAASAVKL